jgi:excisionase family DNA binding protein
LTRLLTTREVAEALGVSSATVLRRWRAGDLPGFRIASNCLRFDEAEIGDWLQERRSFTYSPDTAQLASKGIKSQTPPMGERRAS